MASIRGIGDGLAFQRLLWLLVGTVIVPTVLLSLYGVMAIRNQQAAFLQQVTRERQDRLQAVAQVIFAEIGALDAAVRASVAGCGDLPCEPSVDGVHEIRVWPLEEPSPLPGLGLVAPPGPETTWFAPHDGSDPVGAFTLRPSNPGSATWGVVWRIDHDRLEALLTSAALERFGAGAVLSLEGAAPGPATTVEEMVDRWQRPRTELLLQRPLAQWRLTLVYDGVDPADALLGRTAWLYPLGLVALVTLVVVGTLVTLVSAAREIRLSRLQTDFVSSVSHELRTPLTSIRMFVETLQDGRLEDPDKVQECLDLLSRETDRLSRMIERVLNWARMEAGRRIYEIEDVSAEEVVREALAALRSQLLLAQEAEAVRVDLPEDLPLLRADRDAMVEAMLNLLQNAVKYTPPPRRIAVTATTRGRWVGLSVEDNGPGIPPRDRKRIFEKFYQADNLLSASTFAGPDRGSGLGLSIVRAVVRGHGGKVQLSTELGRGSRFTLWLPRSARSRYTGSRTEAVGAS